MRIPPDRSRALWRRQAVLTALVGISFAVVALLSGRALDAYDESVARQRLSLPAPDHALLIGAFVVAVLVLTALLAAVCVHAYRVVSLTLRRTDDLGANTD